MTTWKYINLYLNGIQLLFVITNFLSGKCQRKQKYGAEKNILMCPYSQSLLITNSSFDVQDDIFQDCVENLEDDGYESYEDALSGNFLYLNLIVYSISR